MKFNNQFTSASMRNYSLTYPRLLSVLVILTLLLFGSSLWFSYVSAAALSDQKDTMSRLQIDPILSDHEIMFETPTGVAAGETMVITFPSDFDGANDPDGAVDFNDVDMYIDSTPDGTCTDGTAATLAATPSGATWGVAASGTEGRIVTITSGSGTVAAGGEVCVQIGENATGGSGNSQYINPTTGGTKVITLAAGSGADTGNISVEILTDDQVSVTAEVGQTMTFSISDTEIGFGTLSSGAATWANGAATGSATDVSAHNIIVGTNGSSGYTVTYNGATLTSGSNTIDVASITDNGDGTPGTEEFGIGLSTSGNATIAAGYEHTSSVVLRDWKWVANTVSTIASETVASANETLSMFYLANIATLTEAGSYSTAVAYTGTANF